MDCDNYRLVGETHTHTTMRENFQRYAPVRKNTREQLGRDLTSWLLDRAKVLQLYTFSHWCAKF